MLRVGFIVPGPELAQLYYLYRNTDTKEHERFEGKIQGIFITFRMIPSRTRMGLINGLLIPSDISRRIHPGQSGSSNVLTTTFLRGDHFKTIMKIGF